MRNRGADDGGGIMQGDAAAWPIRGMSAKVDRRKRTLAARTREPYRARPQKTEIGIEAACQRSRQAVAPGRSATRIAAVSLRVVLASGACAARHLRIPLHVCCALQSAAVPLAH